MFLQGYPSARCKRRASAAAGQFLATRRQRLGAGRIGSLTYVIDLADIPDFNGRPRATLCRVSFAPRLAREVGGLC